MSHSLPLRDRQDAGCQLAPLVAAEVHALRMRHPNAQPIVYALPRGGIPVAEPIAQMLRCPLNVIVAKKITRPDNPELAIGAVTADGQVMRSRHAGMMATHAPLWRSALQSAQTSAREQQACFSMGADPPDPRGAIAILVDDGIATGLTIAAAARSLHSKHPAAMLICAPVAPYRVGPFLKHWGDRILLLAAPRSFLSVSRFYTEFPQVETAEALAILNRHNQTFQQSGLPQHS
ncbi:MAG: phosphoribosyltransferase [Cyanobacteria bacterium J069]|nr:MAG: phosphoribosyltransferase [Cyanobacteria bacterium J069]